MYSIPSKKYATKLRCILHNLKIKDIGYNIYRNNYNNLNGILNTFNIDFFQNISDEDDIDFEKINYIHNETEYKYNNIIFIIVSNKYNNGEVLYLYNKNNENERLIIILNIIEHEGYILDIYNNYNYTNTSIDVGTMLMYIIIDFLKKNKQKYNINKIIVTDTHNKYNNNIRLHIVHNLLYGTNWFGKFGFKPYLNPKYGQGLRSKDIVYGNKLTIDFEKNKNILQKAKLKDISKLKEYIIKNYEQIYDIQNIEYKLETILNIYNVMMLKNENVSYFIYILLKEHDKSCKLFEHLYLDILIDLNITLSDNELFYKNI
jgi:hypothetical protein